MLLEPAPNLLRRWQEERRIRSAKSRGQVRDDMVGMPSHSFIQGATVWGNWHSPFISEFPQTRTYRHRSLTSWV